MKILDTAQLKELDQSTIVNEPIASIDLMERAASTCADWLNDHFDPPLGFTIICGPGNNGGDGLVIARLLSAMERKVHVYADPDSGSPDNRQNYHRLLELGITPHPADAWEKDRIDEDTILVDALFGYGLSRPLEGKWAGLVDAINEQSNLIVSIDIPSGLFMHAPGSGTSIVADFTLTFQTPKLAFFIPENQDIVGAWVVLDIGLNANKLEQLDTYLLTLEKDDVAEMVPTRGKFDHKGTFGHALLVVGSFGKVGAAILAAKAALRSGVGLLTVHVPRQATHILQIAVPEAIGVFRQARLQLLRPRRSTSINRYRSRMWSGSARLYNCWNT